MDELANKVAGLGVAGLVLVGLVATSSYAGAVAITTSYLDYSNFQHDCKGWS
jgi:hypothetical protein